MTQDYEEKRNRALKDRTKYSDDYLEKTDVSFPDGGKSNDPDKFIVKVYRFGDTSRVEVDIREIPWAGIGSG